MLQEFREFIARGNVMDMAVGIAVGAAFTAIVTSLVRDLINPVVALFTGASTSRAGFTSWAGPSSPASKRLAPRASRSSPWARS